MRINDKIVVLLILIFGLNIGLALGAPFVSKEFNNIKIDTCECNYKCWPDLSDSVKDLTTDDIYKFLKTISIDCKNNAEFSEYSNEIIFKILGLNPSNFILVIDKDHNNLDLNEIIKLLKNPLNDTINVKGLYKKINDVKIDSPYKKIILDSLKYAIDLYKK